MKILMIGALPPPIGGISIHHKRFLDFLDDSRKFDIDYTFVDLLRNQTDRSNVIRLSKVRHLYLYLLRNLRKYDIIHISVGSDYRLRLYILFLFVFSKNKKIIFTHHGFDVTWPYTISKMRPNVNMKGRLINKIIFWNFKRCYHICVNSLISELLIEKGTSDRKISVIPAFLLPTADETDIMRLPEYFHKIRTHHKFLITANAFRISFFNAQDLYGIDLSIELIKRLVENGYKNIGFIYVIPDIGDYDYYKKMQNLVKEYNLENNFHFYTEPVAYPAVIDMCDLFIRPTNTDGDALSIREALTSKIPVIASDVFIRPEGTIPFNNRNIDDLYTKTIRVIDNYDEEKKNIENIKFEDNAERILNVYKKVLNEK